MSSLIQQLMLSPEGQTGQDARGFVKSEISRKRGYRVIVIEGGTVLTVDDAGSVHAPGHVVTEGDRIVAVGPGRYRGDDGVAGGRSFHMIDAAGMVVLPGLVDL